MPLILEPKTSRHFILLMVFVHSLTLVVVISLALHWSLKLALALIVGASAYLLYARYVDRRGRNAIRKLLLRGDGTWILSTGDCAHVQAVLQANSYVHPLVLVLNFICKDRRRRSLVLMADALEPELLRKLRVKLRMGKIHQAVLPQ